MIITKKIPATGLFVLLGIGLIIIYKVFDPALTAFFPACPFYTYTGFLCPGCGSQRAIHHLLNFHFSGALTQNPLMVLSLPYVLAGLIIDRLPHYSPAIRKWRQVLFGRKAIYIILAAIISFWIFRNL